MDLRLELELFLHKFLLWFSMESVSILTFNFYFQSGLRLFSACLFWTVLCCINGFQLSSLSWILFLFNLVDTIVHPVDTELSCGYRNVDIIFIAS